MTATESTALQAAARPKFSPWRLFWGLILWVVLPLGVGWIIAQYAIPAPQVGLIRLNTDIYASSADLVSQQIELARTNPRIKAVVIQIDSPGGEVAPTQTMYFDLLALRRKMPVVGSIDSMAASGGFYTAMAADPIYAKPSSTVGNVGVWGFFPPTLGVNDAVLASGPFKLTASSNEAFQLEIDGIKREFLQTVQTQRGARLKMSLEELSQGLAYPGREAQRLGLIDELGSQTDALDKAAALAGIANYEVVDLEAEVIKNLLSEISLWFGAPDPTTGERKLLPGVYLLYDPRLGSTR
jgi:protease IV